MVSTTIPGPLRVRRRHYLLASQGGRESLAAARWLHRSDPAAEVTILYVTQTPWAVWWSEDVGDWWAAVELRTRETERALEELRRALGLPETRVRVLLRHGSLAREVRHALRGRRYAAVVMGRRPGVRGPRLPPIDVPVVLVPDAGSGRLRALRP